MPRMLPGFAAPTGTARAERFATRTRVRLRTAAGFLLLAAILVPLQSLFWTNRVPALLKAAPVALAALAVWRPGDALLALTGLLPFTYVLTTRVWTVHPLALAEALVLAFFAGYLLRPKRPAAGQRPADPLSAPAWCFALVLLASCAVQLTVVRTWHDYPIEYACTFATYLARDYLTSTPDPRPWVEGHGFVTTAALLLEGVALLRATRRLTSARLELSRQMLRMAVVAGAGAAMLNIAHVLEAVLRRELPFADAFDSHRRWTMFIPSLNTSGPYFTLVAFIAFGGAATARWRTPWAMAGLLALTAMWLTGTRSARVAGVAVFGATLVWLWLSGRSTRTLKRAALVAGAVALVLALAVVATNPLGILAIGAYRSLDLRVLLAQAAVRIFTTEPWFGIGVGQYGLYYPHYAPAALLAEMPKADAHNYFLWIAAELGLVGLGAFLWLLGAAAALVGRRLLREPRNPEFLGLCGGLAAFGLTWLTGQPLGVPLVAYTFWILLGVALTGNQEPESRLAGEKPAARPSLLKRLALGTAAIAVLASIPFRIARAMEEVDFARVTYGFYGWDQDAAGTRYRWTGPRATLFFRSSVRVVELPVRVFPPARLGIDAFEVRLFTNRRHAGFARLTNDQWVRLRVPAPPDAARHRYWRLDLYLTPSWRPAARLPGSTDARELGVMVGEIRRGS